MAVYVFFAMMCAAALPMTANASNPYGYSNAPSRAIYYTLPTRKGNGVKWVQAVLNAYGNYGLVIDGTLGPATR